jgi:class 3 adenylate cyclase
MNERNNKTSICSIVFLDIIDYSKKTDSEQIEVKNQFNALINNALKDVAENDRIILDTGDGAAIACDGSPEDVLFISLNIRDEILKNNIHSAMPLYVRFGVNLGPVRVVKDINGRPNIIGDGINVAQRIMSFAKPNQILVSRSYYEVTSRLTQEISQMFDYSGVKQDKHVREHEIYSVRLLTEQTDVNRGALASPQESLPAQPLLPINKVNWKYAMLAAPALIAFFLIVKNASGPVQPTITIDNTAATKQIAAAASETVKTMEAKSATLPKSTSKDVLLPNESLETVPSAASLPIKDAKKNAAKTDVAEVDKRPKDLLEIETKKKAKQKAKKKAEEAAQKTLAEEKPQHGTVVPHKEVAVVTSQAKKDPVKEKPGYIIIKDSVKQNGENKCSQAQIAMNQCN